MKNILIALCVLSTAAIMSCRKHYNEVSVPYNGTSYGNYTYTTQTDYYNEKDVLSETRVNTGTVYLSNFANPENMTIIPLYGYDYTLELSDWNTSNNTFKIANQEIYINNRRLKVSPTKTGKINTDGSLDYGYESFDYATSSKTINTAHAVIK